MESPESESHEEFVLKLTTGFGAMLEQIKELARRNTDLEQRLAEIQDEVGSLPIHCGRVDR